MKKKQQNKIILFDGYCLLCSWAVRFILKRDKNKAFYFTDLNSVIAKSFLKTHAPDLGINQSVILIDFNRFYLKSEAVLRICKELTFPWNYFYYFKFIPKKIRDYIYDIVAKNRKSWFGASSSCYIPSSKEKEQFL